MRKLVLFFVILMAYNAVGQDSPDSINYSIHLISKYVENENKVILRWAPSEASPWEIGNHYGYVVEKRVLDTTSNEKEEWGKLAEIKPLSLDEWRKRVENNLTDTMLMVAGQAIHGERDKSPITIYNLQEKSDQFENLYSACMLACAFSREAALASALRFEDTDVKKGQIIVYRVIINNPDTLADIIMGSTGLSCYEEPLPTIEISNIYQGEKYVEIFWDRLFYDDYYTAYNIYRSDKKGKKWKKLNKAPTAFIAYTDDSKYIFRDSLTVNYEDYLYRIEGLTSFAEIGPLSKDIKAQGVDRTRPDAPYNIRTEYLGNGRMKITWKVNSKDKDIAGFRISRSNEIDKGFIELTDEPLPPDTRSFIDENCNELINNYYFIGVFDKSGNVNVSMPEHGTIIDSIPPEPPTGLEGIIDTNGVVTLKWRLGDEIDLKGYYVHMSNHPDHEYYNVTPYPLQDTVFRDTFPTNILNKDVYYKVVAIDHRSNYSNYSDPIILKRPDLFPPTEPVIVDIKSSEEGIVLHYYTSSSMDVIEHRILRRFRGEGEYQVIHTTGTLSDEETYLDKDLKPGKQYEYLVRAVDESDLTSDSPASVFATAYILKQLKDIKDFSYSYDAKKKECVLNWDYDADPQVFFNIYRSIGDYPYTMYQSRLTGRSFTDSNIVPEKNVKYRIIAVSKKNGWQSAFSNEIVIK